MVLGVWVVHSGDPVTDRAVAASPGITNKDPTMHCWPWERAKFQIPIIVSSECVSLAHKMLKNHNFGIEFKGQNKKPSGTGIKEKHQCHSGGRKERKMSVNKKSGCCL